MQESLRDKTIRGVGWSFIDNIASSGTTFFVGLVLARLLTPSEYGIMSIIAILVAVSNSIIDSGFSNALIRKVRIERIDYNTVFYFNLLVSVLLFLILFFSSPSISRFFNEPVLIDVVKVVGIILIINALGLIPRTITVRDINFKLQTKISLISSLCSGTIGISMAIGELGVWSLVGQQISRQIINTLFLWIYSKWHPVWEFSMKSFKELFGFGSKLLLSGLLDTIYKNIYYIIIGRFYAPSQLGQYTRAEQFNTIFSTNLTSVVQRVSYPVLSSIQNESERLKIAYRKVIKVTMMITFTCMLGLAAIAKPLIIILIGEKWLPAVYYLQIICFSGMLYPLHAINLNILQVKGRSDLVLKLEVIKKIIAIIPIVIGVFYGIEYMLWGGVFNSVLAYFLNSHYSASLISYSTIDQIKDILPTLFISFVIAFVMWTFSLFSFSYYIMIPIQILVGTILIVTIYEKLHIEEFIEIKQLVISVLQRK